MMFRINAFIYHTFLWIVHYIIDSIVIFFRKSQKTGSHISNNIAVVKVDRIGDFILWIQAARNLKSNLENNKITLIVDEANFETADYLNFFDEIKAINIKKYTRNLFYRTKINKDLAYRNYSTIYHPTYSRFFSTGDSIVRILNSINKIGFLGDKKNQISLQKKISDKWYNKLVTANPNSKMMLELHGDFVKQTYNKKFENKFININFNMQKKYNNDEKFFVCAPFSSQKARDWSLKSYIKLINLICKKNKIAVVVCGSISQESIIKKLVKLLDVKNINIATGSLIKYFNIVSNAEFFIGSDSGPAHIAALLGKKTFVIQGGSKIPEQFFPYKAEKDEKTFFPIIIKNTQTKDANTAVEVSYAIEIIQNEIFNK